MKHKSPITARMFRKRRATWLALVVLTAGGFTPPLLAQHGGGGMGGMGGMGGGHGGGMGGMGGMGGGHFGGGYSGGGHLGGGYVSSGHVGGVGGGSHFGAASPSVGHIGGAGSVWGTGHIVASPFYGSHWGYTPAYHSGSIYGGTHYTLSWHYGSTYGLYHGYGSYDHWGYSWHPYYHHAYPVYYGHGYFGSYWSGYYYPYYYPAYSAVTYYDTPASGYVTSSSTNGYAPANGFSDSQRSAPRTQSDARFIPRAEIQTQEAPEALPDENQKGTERP